MADLPVRADLGREHPRDDRHFLGVGEDVLAVARPVMEAAQGFDELGRHIVQADVEDDLLALLVDLLGDLASDLLDDLLDPCRVYATVGDEPLEGNAGDLAANRIETGDDDRLGRIVDDDVDAREGLEGTDIAALRGR